MLVGVHGIHHVRVQSGICINIHQSHSHLEPDHPINLVM